jgi:hypothetical protein
VIDATQGIFIQVKGDGDIVDSQDEIGPRDIPRFAPHDGDKDLLPARLYCSNRLRGLPEAYGDVDYSYGGEIKHNLGFFAMLI